MKKYFPDFEYQRVSRQALEGSLANRPRLIASIFNNTDQEQDGQVSVGIFASGEPHVFTLWLKASSTLVVAGRSALTVPR